ncbi:MAG TPA: hypothetical protein VJH91_00010 [Candidatus Paceibacterota bacterium]
MWLLLSSVPLPLEAPMQHEPYASYGECHQGKSAVIAKERARIEQRARELGNVADVVSIRVDCRRVRDNRLEDILPRQ